MLFLKPFTRYFQFSGRAGRAEFWQYIAFIVIVSLLLNLLELGATLDAAAVGETYIPVFSTIFSLLTFVPTTAVIFRRLHDVNKSGWYYGWMFIALAPVVVLIIASASFESLWPVAMAVLACFIIYSFYLVYELAQRGDWYENHFGEPDDETISIPSVGPLVSPRRTPQSSINSDPFEHIERLAQLHSQGALTDEEFAAQKSRILGGM